MSRNNELNYPECKFKKSLLSGKLVVISLCLLNFILLSIGGLYYKANRLKEASISESSNLQTCYDLICNTRDEKFLNSCSHNISTHRTKPVRKKRDVINYRLPLNLRPFFYEIQLQPFIGPNDTYGNKSFTTQGTTRIDFTCVTPTHKIYFHAKNLSIDSFRISSVGDMQNEVVQNGFDYDYQTDFGIVTLENDCIAATNYSLTIQYKGLITEHFGLYKSAYKDKNGTTHYLAITQFEPSDARRVFPCFDEPAFKAQFQLKMIRHKNFTSSHFNTPLANSLVHQDDSDWFVDTFEKTVQMSTYLVGFVVSDFKSIRMNSPKYGINTEIVARPDAIDSGMGEIALKEAVKIIDFFVDYFNVSYPLKKISHIAVPDFFAGAMENWGVVIYRERYLLFDPEVDSFNEKKRIFEVIYHEVAHQWFGNLVSPSWWTDLWLNEGFASWFECIGKNFTHPQWADNDNFFVNKIPTMTRDSLDSTHSVRFEVFNPGEIKNLFDDISYHKGSSIIRMMNAFLTERTFKRGLTNYLNKYAFKNAEQDNLWEELTKQGHLDESLDPELNIKEIMDTWTLQKGYPVVQVNRNGNSLHIAQKWFLLNNIGENVKDLNENKWYVPFTFTTKNELNFDFESKTQWLKPNQTELIVQIDDTSCDNETWILANLKHAGFYRVNYNKENWELIIKQLQYNYTQIDITSRAQLVDDSFNLGRAGIIDQEIFLQIIDYLKYESKQLPIKAALYGINFIGNMLSRRTEFEYYKKFYINTFSKVLIDFKEADSIEEVELNQNIVRYLCKYGDVECIQFAKESLSSAEMSIVEKIALPVYIEHECSNKDWIKLYNSLENIDDYSSRIRMMITLTNTKNIEFLTMLLEQSTNETLIKKQDQPTLLKSVAKNLHGKNLAINYLDKNWDTFIKKYDETVFIVADIIKSVFSDLNTQEDLNLIQAFTTNHKNLGSAAGSFQQLTETVIANMHWMDKNFNSVVRWLELKAKSNGPKEYRLPKDLMPTTYHIFIQPNFTALIRPDNYKAQIRIDFNCTKDTPFLILHMKDIELNKETLFIESSTHDGYGEIKRISYSYDSDTELFTAKLPTSHAFKANNSYSFHASFVGNLKDDNKGFYRSSYYDSNQTERWLLVSQFECIEARKAFICFDEPGFKAKFNIIVRHDPSLIAFSNMPVASKIEYYENGSNWTETTFLETFVMPIYSIGLVIADFKCSSTLVKSNSSHQNLNISICARENAMSKTKALENCSLNSLDYFERKFDSKFPLSKIDHISVPDFDFGAMENWGIVVYREDLIFFDNSTEEAHLQMVARVVNHEISHMWFGNLVTPKWWEDLWLNEGFARYFDYTVTDHLYPEWKLNDDFEVYLMQIIHFDSFNILQPISFTIESPKQVNRIINPYSTYGKGSAIVRMLNYILGKDNLSKGLTKYFNKFQYKSVEQKDLWNILQENNQNVTDLANKMTLWTRNNGVPVVTIKALNSSHISLTQKPFLMGPNISEVYPSNNTVKYNKNYSRQTWHIPFTYTVDDINSLNDSFTNHANMNNMFDKIVWLEPSRDNTVIKLNKELTNETFLLANLNFAGFYRVNYDTENWIKIARQLKSNRLEISKTMRGQLLNDAFSLARSNEIEPFIPLELAGYLVKENEFIPWQIFLNNIEYYTSMLLPSPFYGQFQEYLAKLVEPVYHQVGWMDKESIEWLNKKLRRDIVKFACRHEVKACVQASTDIFNDYIANETSIMKLPKSLRSTAFCTVIRNGGRHEHELLENKLKTDIARITDILAGLLCTKDRWRLNKYLQIANDFGFDFLREQAVNTNSNGNFIIWDFIKNKLQNKKLTIGDNIIILIDKTAKVFNTISQYEDFTQFYKQIKNQLVDEKSRLNLENTANSIMSNIEWVKYSNLNPKIWIDRLNTFLPVVNSTESLNKELSYRLPDNLVPHSYEITLQPYIGNYDIYGNKSFTFNGRNKISFKCVKPTSVITFHSENLQFETITVTDSTGNMVQIFKRNDITFDELRDFTYLQLKKECVANMDYTMDIIYTGMISDQLNGFYKSSYYLNDTIAYLATTHFQPNHARQAFPCFDEPAMKANFTLRMIRHINFTNTAFNTPLMNTEPFESDPNWVVDIFEETVPMSTYLVGFVVSNFEMIKKNSSKYGIEIEVLARPEAIEMGSGDYALNETSKIIDYFADYFNTSYPLKKSTQIAVPDFESGAMENWGVIIYRELALLTFGESIQKKNMVTQIISHELAHQWFGNLVTLEWWNDLWLNEGFASWVEYLGMDHSHPEWRVLDFFKVQTSDVMIVDSLESSHPISVDVNDSDEITSLFDLISYYKGSNIIRMMNAFLTEATFKKATEKYLRRYKYSIARQDNLWDELTRQAHSDKSLDNELNIKDIMDTWTLQKGYPIVQVNCNRSVLNITQKWFLINPISPALVSSNQSEFNSYKWYVPFTYTTREKANFNFETKPTWLKPNESELIIELPDTFNNESWVLANIKQAGYYRVNYNNENWRLLIDQLHTNHTAIDSLNRAQLIEDSFNLGRAEVIDQNIFFEIIDYLVYEEDPLPFKAAINGLKFIDNMFSSDYFIYEAFKIFYMKLIEPTYLKYGWRDDIEDLNELDLQLSAIQIMCMYGREDCLDKSREVYKNWISVDFNGTDDKFLKIAICTVIKYSSDGNSEWFTLYDFLVSTKMDSYLEYLSCTDNYNLLKLSLALSSQSSLVRSQDQTWFITNIAKNQIGKGLAYDYLEENWEELFDKYGRKSVSMIGLIDELFINFNTKYELSRVEKFISERTELGVTKSSFARALEGIRSNIRWREKNMITLTDWLSVTAP